MFGPIFLMIYRLIALWALLLPKAQGRALKARWALRFAAMSDGGLDDDFCEQLFQLIRAQPELLDRLQPELSGGGGWVAERRRLALASIRQAHAAGSTSIFS